VLLATGCQGEVPTDANGIPQFIINAEDVSSVEIVTKKQSGFTEIHLTLTKAKLDELRHFDHLVIDRCFPTRSAHAKVWVGQNVVKDCPDFRLAAQGWLSNGGKAVAYYRMPSKK
jgi:hypothetical protein